MEMDALENAIVCYIYKYIHKKNVVMTVALKYIHIYDMFLVFGTAGRFQNDWISCS